MILYLSLLCGILLVALGKLNRVYGKPDFSWKIFFQLNAVSLAMNLVAGLFLLINQAELLALFAKVFPSFEFVAGGLFSGILGISGITIVQYLVELLDPKHRTKIGINK